jgi:hypothetical protein
VHRPPSRRQLKFPDHSQEAPDFFNKRIEQHRPSDTPSLDMTMLTALPSLARSSMFTLRASSNSRRAFRAWLSSAASCSWAFWDCSSLALVSKENRKGDELQ